MNEIGKGLLKNSKAVAICSFHCSCYLICACGFSVDNWTAAGTPVELAAYIVAPEVSLDHTHPNSQFILCLCLPPVLSQRVGLTVRASRVHVAGGCSGCVRPFKGWPGEPSAWCKLTPFAEPWKSSAASGLVRVETG